MLFVFIRANKNIKYSILSAHICLYVYIKLTALLRELPRQCRLIEKGAWASDRGVMLSSLTRVEGLLTVEGLIRVEGLFRVGFIRVVRLQGLRRSSLRLSQSLRLTCGSKLN